MGIISYSNHKMKYMLIAVCSVLFFLGWFEYSLFSLSLFILEIGFLGHSSTFLMRFFFSLTSSYVYKHLFPLLYARLLELFLQLLYAVVINYFILCLSLKIFISSSVLKQFFLVDIAISLAVIYSQCLKYILHFSTFKDSTESSSFVMINLPW